MPNRPILCLLALVTLASHQFGHAEAITKGQRVAPFTPQIKSGQYVWHPEASPSGPVVIIVSLSEQVLYVYRNGVRIGRSSLSSAKPGYRTPTGVFTILEKNVKHISSLYKGASMPYMERLTWRGVALHGGDLPGYPASHGCVRLPLDFAQRLYSVTREGTTVIVTNEKPAPGRSSEPGLLFTGTASAAAPMGGVVWQPAKAPAGPVSIVLSSANQAAYVYRDGTEIGRAPVRGLRGFKGTYVYTALNHLDAQGKHDWLASTSMGGRPPNLKNLVKKTSQDQTFLAEVSALIIPGTTLVLTDQQVSTSARRGPGVAILTTAEAP